MINIKYNKGFTLVELIVSLAITSILMLAFFTIINSSIRNNSKNESDIKSLHVAQSEIENLRQQIKSGNNGEINIKVNGKTIEFINNIGNVDGKKDILYKRDLGDKTYLIKLNISRENINKYDGYLYDIDIKSKLYNKKKDDVEKYVSKKETRLTTKILSNNQIDGGDIITPEYNNGSLFVRLANENIMAGNYITDGYSTIKEYYNNYNTRTLKAELKENSNVEIILKNKDGKFDISGSVDTKPMSSIYGTKISYYTPTGILIDPKNHKQGGSNTIEINRIEIKAYNSKDEQIYDKLIEKIVANGEMVELGLSDSDITKIRLTFNLKFNDLNDIAHIVFGKEK